MAVTFSPLAFRTRPMDEAVMPFPSPDKTPPETTMTFIFVSRDLQKEVAQHKGLPLTILQTHGVLHGTSTVDSHHES